MLRRKAGWALALVVGLSAVIAVVLLALRPPAPLIVAQRDIVLSGVTVINPGAGRRDAQRIAIRGPTIHTIEDDTAQTTPSTGIHRFPGAYVLPGLIDMHVHHPPARAVLDTQLFALLYLAHGVTTVRDTGNFDGSILHTRARILSGEFAGPRIFACGPIIDGDPPVWPGSVVVHSAEEAEDAVEAIAATGVHCIKTYQNLTADALRGVRTAAVRHHLPVVGHVPFAVSLADAHLDDVQHLTGVTAAAAHPAGASLPELIDALLRAWADLEDAQVRQVVRASVEQHLVHTPTIVVIDQLSRMDAYSELVQEPDVRLLPRAYREILWGPMDPLDGARSARPDGAVVRANVRKVVRQLHEAGVTLHVGTDVLNPFVVPGAAMHRELRNLTECGLTPEQAWAAATRDNGSALPEPRLGILAPGAPADLLVFRDDPTRDLAALATLEAVVADGRFYPKTALDAAAARYRRTLESWLYDCITRLNVQASRRQ